MDKNMRKIPGITCTAVIVLLLVACSGKKQHFTIDGEIAGGAGKMLYLENVGIAKIVAVDSIQLKSDHFKFRHKRPAVPDFYRLRLGRQVINLAIDSTETIHINADTVRFAKDYSLEGDVVQSQKIKELTLLQSDAALQYRDLQKQYESGVLSTDQYVENAYRIVNTYKTEASHYIHPDYLSLSAYFALFQQLNNMYFFDIYDKNDNKLYGAVANAWNTFYPESPRANQLKNIFTNSRAVIRGEKESLDVQEVDSKTAFDIALPSLDGQTIRLSEIGDDQLVLIDFTAYTANGSPAHNLQLAELYDLYRSQGLEIYQISLDADNHLWKNAAVNLPWVCVRDPESAYSTIAKKYNVVNIPTTFIRNRKGEIVTRIEDYSTLNASVSKYLK